jgi:hypothetical protein
MKLFKFKINPLETNKFLLYFLKLKVCNNEMEVCTVSDYSYSFIVLLFFVRFS